MKLPLLLLAIFLALPMAARSENLDVLPEKISPGVPKSKMMHEWLLNQALEALDGRAAAFEKALESPEAMRQWQTERRDFFRKQLGGFPERTPLNAQVVGNMEFDDYRIEKILFESQPRFYVTSTLYLPKGEGPFPAVLHPTGHSANAKGRDLYQQASVVIAKGGCAVLCYDPVGQGERRHFFNADGTPRFATTQEHMLMNQGSMLLGSNTARYMIWDGMRAIDYLQSRADIDPEKIGCTGISGGGTNTSYLMALDDRIKAAAPGCYLTGYRKLLTTIGPQDAEQNIHGQLAFGMDHADYVLMRAPQATLIMAATQDYFDIEGAWDLFRQAKRFYTTLGYPERVNLVEPDTKHGFPTEMRVAAANWMRRWLLDTNETVGEPEISALPEEELYCTAKGQVLKLPGARSLFDLNVKWSRSFQEERENLWERPAAAKAKVRELIGTGHHYELAEPKVEMGASLVRDGNLRIQKLTLEPEPGIELPALLLSPEKFDGNLRTMIYLHEDGKHAEAGTGGLLEELSLSGIEILAVDLRGFGETEPEATGRHFDDFVGPDWRETTMASLLGKSYVGMRVEDIWHCVHFLRERANDPKLRPALVAVGQPGVPALHAVALEPDLFESLRLRQTVQSWAEVVETPVVLNQQPNLVFGALRYYDLPKLYGLLPPQKLTIEDPAPAGE